MTTQAPEKFGDLLRLSLARPRTMAQIVLLAQVPMALLWQGLIALAAATAVIDFAYFNFFLSGDIAMPSESEFDTMFEQMVLQYYAMPFFMALVEGSFMAGVALAIYHIGQAFGGVGGLRGALALTVWHQAVFLVLHVGGLLIDLILPSVYGGVSVALLVLALYVLAQFVRELHDFDSLPLVMIGLVGGGLVLAFVMSVIAVIFFVVFFGGSAYV